MMSRWTRAGAVGAMAAGAVAVGASLAAPSGAQTEPPSTIVHPGTDSNAVISDDGRLVVFVSNPLEPSTEPSGLMLHDRGPVVADVDGGVGVVGEPTTVLIAGSQGATNPSISGDGCIVTWSVLPVIAPPVDEPDPPVDESVPPVDVVADGPVDGGGVDGDGAPVDEDAVDDAGAADPVADGAGEADPVADDPVAGDPVADEPVVGGPVVEPLQAADAELFLLDRCAEVVVPAEPIASAGLGLSFGAAALSVDGAVLAVSDGADIVRFARSVPDGEYVETDRFDGPGDPTAEQLASLQLDVSDDGAIIVFAAGADLADVAEMTVFTHEIVDGVPLVTAVLAAADHPSISGDANTIAVTTAQGVAVVGRGDTPFTAIDLGPGLRPAISADGNHVVIEGSGVLSIVSRTGQGAQPFATRETTILSSTIAPTRSGPAIDRLGTNVVSDVPVALDAVTAETDIAITTIAADAGFDAELFDLGKGDVGAELTTSVTFSNRGPASVGVSSLTVDGTFQITGNDCGDILRPGTTCIVGVAFEVERLQDAFGVVTLERVGFGNEPLATEVTALGEAPFVEPSTTVTTTTVASTTGGGSTGSSTTRGTSTTSGTSSSSTSGGSRTTSTTGSSSTGGTATTTTTTTTTTLPLGAGVVASPAAFEFAPTIVDAGRRTGLVEIVNNGTRAVTVVGVRLEPADAGAFSIVETTCAGESIAPGTRCAVTLAFAPTNTGPQSIQLIASLEGGTDIIVEVTGTGAPAPVVAVIPGVANVGQVVTLSGSGFPTGITVQLTWGATAQNVIIDEVGTFNVPVVVLTNTPRGPAEATVVGQVDLFGDVTATMLITDTSDRSSPSVIDGVGPNIGR